MIHVFSQPWPWWISGPLIGVVVPLLLLLGNKQFGISSNLRHLCAAICPAGLEFFEYDWKRAGLWNLTFILGVFVGGLIAGTVLAGPGPDISAATRADLARLGVAGVTGIVPSQLFNWHVLATFRGLLFIVGGGFLVGFGTAYAGGCTSGHAISGLADRQLPSLIAVLGFFAGGMLTTYLVLPWLLA
jgi:uncharacterized membrane protein YedE/YeeE